MIHCHAELTASLLAYRVLANWEDTRQRIVKVFPKDYKRMLQAMREVEASGVSGEEAVMAAFELNIHDLVRVSGN
jgi:glutamate synthase (ferredoxin)